MAGPDVDHPQGPLTPTVDSIYNNRLRDVAGNKSDAPSNANTASVIAHLKWLEGALGAGAYYLVPTSELPEITFVGSGITFAITLINRQTGVSIPVADITPGTIDVIRVRAGAETTIHAGVSLLKKDGILYYTIQIASANWAIDDVCRVEQNTKSTVDIGGDTYDVTLIPQGCLVTDLGDQIDTIESIVTETNGYLEEGGRIDNLLDQIILDVADVQTDVTAILADTNELQTDWADGGRLDNLIDAILADTNELQTDWTDGGRLDLILDDIDADVDTILTNTINIEAKVDNVYNDTQEIISILGGPSSNKIHEIMQILKGMTRLYGTGGKHTAGGLKKVLFLEDSLSAPAKEGHLLIDCDNMVAGDTIVLYEEYTMPDGNSKQYDEHTLTGIDGGLDNGVLFNIHLLPVPFGRTVWLHQTASGAGGNKDFQWLFVSEA
jgi:hypothetical protein